MSNDERKPYELLENILVLKKSPLFSSVTTSELRTVAEVIEELTFISGEAVVKENDVGDSMYLIKKGRVKISKKIGGGEAVDLAVLSEGECFGEMSAVDEEVRSASAFADGECTLLRINRENLIDVVLECPNIGVELLKIFVKRLRTANSRIESLSVASR